jgi:hypothetical protein
MAATTVGDILSQLRESNKQLTKSNKILIKQLKTSIEANNVLHKKIGSQKPSQTPAQEPSGGQLPFDQKAWEANLDPNRICWTQRFHIQKVRKSANCKGKLGGHKNDATRNNNKGGSTKGKDWHIGAVPWITIKK